MEAGELVPPHVLFTMIGNRVTEPDAAHGYVFENLPVTRLQPSAVDETLDERGASLDRVVHLHLIDAEIVRRLCGRRVCHGCGRVWHVETAPTRRAGICDRCGGHTRQREVDSPESVAIGLSSYRPAVAPALTHYAQAGILRVVDATLPTPRLLDEALA